MLQFPDSWDSNSLPRQIAFYAGYISNAINSIRDEQDRRALAAGVATRSVNPQDPLNIAKNNLKELYYGLIGLLQRIGDEEATAYANLLITNKPNCMSLLSTNTEISSGYDTVFLQQRAAKYFDFVNKAIQPLNVQVPNALGRFFTFDVAERARINTLQQTKVLYDQLFGRLNALPSEAKVCVCTPPAAPEQFVDCRHTS